MIERIDETSIILMAEDSLQSSLLKDILETKLNIYVHLVAPKSEFIAPYDEANVAAILIDYSVMSEANVNWYKTFKKNRYSHTAEILINCDKTIENQVFFSWDCLTGIFYTTDSIDTLKLGIEKVLQGDMWFSREFSRVYITYLRQYSRPVNKNLATILTNREKQIITLLSLGYSNVKISEYLFVSENTVKTHLHNIFKKIGVKNRVQALIWAKENVDESEFNESMQALVD